MKKAKLPENRFRSQKAFALTAVAAAVVGVASPSAMAQNSNQVEQLEEIVVTGIRNSLEQAADIKRNSDGVVDAISAEDIGKFPDSNLAESLQRIAGVSIDRQNNEGNQITVRGFGPRFNLVTLNGRSMPTSNALFQRFLDRSFNFNELASTSVSAVEVYKTGRADLPTGGIGSTVNIRTAKPFDFDGLKVVASLKGNIDTTVETGSDITPDGVFMISNTFADEKVGLLASVSYSERDSRQESVQIDGGAQRVVDNGPVDAGIDSSRNTNPRNALFLPRSVQFNTIDYERKRTNAQFVAQFRPNEDLEIDVDYTLSRFEELGLRNSTGFWFGFWGQRQGAADEQGVVSIQDSGLTFITNPTGTLGPDPIDIDGFGFVQDLKTDNDSIGINIDWSANENLNFTFDAHSSDSESQPDGGNAETFVNFRSQPLDFARADFGDGDIPTVSFGALPGEDPFRVEDIIFDLVSQRGRRIKNEIDEVKLSGEYRFDGEIALKSIVFGGALQDFTYSAEERNDFAIVDVAPGDPRFDRTGLNIRSVPVGSQFSDFNGGSVLPRTWIYDPRDVVNSAQRQGFFQQFATTTEAFQQVQEDVTALFLQTRFEASIGDMPLQVNAGIRYEETEVIGSSSAQPIVDTELVNSAQIQLVRGEGQIIESITGEYDFVLPSIDAKLDVSDNFLIRASYSETITRPQISLLTPQTNFTALRPGVGGGDFNAQQGNASLEPSQSDNLDLSFEWYYKEGSYASVGFFQKDVNAFEANELTETTLPRADGTPILAAGLGPARVGCPGPGCFSAAGDPEIVFDVTRPINANEDAKVRGLELALQHTFENGFGFVANYTYTDGENEFDRSNFFDQERTPLPGLSDSANLVGFYEKGQYQVRVAYNWRDEFLVLAGEEPLFNEEYGQIDFSASYQMNDTISFFVEGLNITDETTRTHGRSSRLLQQASSSGPRFAVGVRGDF